MKFQPSLSFFQRLHCLMAYTLVYVLAGVAVRGYIPLMFVPLLVAPVDWAARNRSSNRRTRERLQLQANFNAPAYNGER